MLSWAAENWARPRANDAEKRGVIADDPRNGLPAQALEFSRRIKTTRDGSKSSKNRRRLNPLFVEWLMGWPLGMTEFAPLETASSRYKQLLHTELSRLVSQPESKQVEMFSA